MRHGEVSSLTVGVFDSTHGISYSVLVGRLHLNNPSGNTGRDHDFMLGEEVVLESRSKNISANNHISNLHLRGSEVPQFVLIERGHIDTTRYKEIFALLSDSLEGSLNSIEDSLQDTYTRRHVCIK